MVTESLGTVDRQVAHKKIIVGNRCHAKLSSKTMLDWDRASRKEGLGPPFKNGPQKDGPKTQEEKQIRQFPENEILFGPFFFRQTVVISSRYF